VGAGIDRALIHRQLNHVRFVDNWIDSPLHPRLEQRLQALAELIVQQRFKRGILGQIAIGLLSRNLGFPLVALKWR
jgi:hypothetical protein